MEVGTVANDNFLLPALIGKSEHLLSRRWHVDCFCLADRAAKMLFAHTLTVGADTVPSNYNYNTSLAA